VSQNKLPTTLPTIEKLIQRVVSAEKTQQKDIRISIDEARLLTAELAILTSRLGSTVTEIHQILGEIKETTALIDVKFDGGSF